MIAFSRNWTSGSRASSNSSADLFYLYLVTVRALKREKIFVPSSEIASNGLAEYDDDGSSIKIFRIDVNIGA